MTSKKGATSPAPRQVPLDHLRPGGRHPSTGDMDHSNAAPGEPHDASSTAEAQPAQPVTPGQASADAARGRATGSPADVGTRDHLEGSGQSPR